MDKEEFKYINYNVKKIIVVIVKGGRMSGCKLYDFFLFLFLIVIWCEIYVY